MMQAQGSYAAPEGPAPHTWASPTHRHAQHPAQHPPVAPHSPRTPCLHAPRFLLARQKYLEALRAGDTTTALRVLRGELSALASGPTPASPASGQAPAPGPQGPGEGSSGPAPGAAGACASGSGAAGPQGQGQGQTYGGVCSTAALHALAGEGGGHWTPLGEQGSWSMRWGRRCTCGGTGALRSRFNPEACCWKGWHAGMEGKARVPACSRAPVQLSSRIASTPVPCQPVLPLDHDLAPQACCCARPSRSRSRGLRQVRVLGRHRASLLWEGKEVRLMKACVGAGW